MNLDRLCVADAQILLKKKPHCASLFFKESLESARRLWNLINGKSANRIDLLVILERI